MEPEPPIQGSCLGQFCLCYEGRKHVIETTYLRDYGIMDGDQASECLGLQFQ
ncbi:hypothetical protein HN51_065889 [Arachis hypogaea]